MRLSAGWEFAALDAGIDPVPLYSSCPEGWKDAAEPRYVKIPGGLLDMSEKKLNEGYVYFPKDPEILAQYCQKKAFIYESLSGIVILGGLFMNYFLLWFFFLR